MFQGGTYVVIDNFPLSGEVLEYDDGVVTSIPILADEDKSATIIDDDDIILLPLKANWSTFNAKCKPAFIEAVEVLSASDMTVTFQATIDDSPATKLAVASEKHDLQTEPMCWVAEVH